MQTCDLEPLVRAVLSATRGPGASVAKAPASIRLDGRDGGVAPALLAARSRDVRFEGVVSLCRCKFARG
jgi:hypothetical protein